MPALVKSRLGASGISEDEGTIECSFDSKNSRNDWRIWSDVMLSYCPADRTDERRYAMMAFGYSEILFTEILSDFDLFAL